MCTILLLDILYTDKSGQALTEYGLILSFVVVTLIAALGLLGNPRILNLYNKIIDALNEL